MTVSSVERSTRGAGRRAVARGAAVAALTLDQGAVLANQKVEMGTLLVGKLEEDLLAFGVLEFLAVLLEEAVRTALATNADHQRLLIVDTAGEPLGAVGEEAFRGVLEEEERRARLEVRVTQQQLAVARLELAQMLLFLLREVLEDLAA